MCQNDEKVLALTGSKLVHKATHTEKGESVTMLACTNAVGSNWIPPMILYKGKYAKFEYGQDLPPGSIFTMTPKGYITKESFCAFLRHFQEHSLPGTALLILDGHRSHIDLSAIELAEQFNIVILCLPSHCSYELQPLDVSCFKSLKNAWHHATDSFRRMYPGRPLNKQQFPTLFSRAWYKAATPQNAVSGFRSSGIYPYNPDVFPEMAFAPSTVSERPAFNLIHQEGTVDLPSEPVPTTEKEDCQTPESSSPKSDILSTLKVQRKNLGTL